MKLPFRFAPTLLIAGAAAHVHALGLGPVQGQAVIGQTLRSEIPLIDAGAGLSVECFSILPGGDGIPAEHRLRDWRFHLETAHGAPRLVLTTRTPVHQPVIEFRLAVGCGHNLQRDYSLLPVAPQTLGAPLRPLPAGSSAVTVPEHSVPVAAPALVPPVDAPASSDEVLPSAQSMPDGIAPQVLTLTEPMTLEALARAHYPGPLRRERFMRWVREANPWLPADGMLAAGTKLLIPSKVPPRRPGDHQAGAAAKPVKAAPARVNVPTAMLQAGAPRAPARPSRPEPSASEKAAVPVGRPAGESDRLVLGGGDALAGSDPAQAHHLVGQLGEMLDRQAVRQTEMAGRIGDLERSLAELARLLAESERRAQVREAQWQEMQQMLMQQNKAGEARGVGGLWQLLMAVIAGGLLGAGLLLNRPRLEAWLAHLRRRPARQEDAPDPRAIDTAIADMPAQTKGNESDRGASGTETIWQRTAYAPTIEAATPPQTSAAPATTGAAAPQAIVQVPVEVPHVGPALTFPSQQGAVPDREPAQAAIATDEMAESIRMAESAGLPLLDIELPGAAAAPAVTVEPHAGALPEGARGGSPDVSAGVPAEALLPDLEFEFPTSAPQVIPEPTVAASAAEAAAEVPVTIDEALQLVDIMMSLGLVDGAAQALVEHIAASPRRSLHYWFRLLDIYRVSGKREDFEHWAQQLRMSFNVDASSWECGEERSLLDYPHIVANLVAFWGTVEAVTYMRGLLDDHRDGTRAGFPRSVAEEILLLIAIAVDEVSGQAV